MRSWRWRATWSTRSGSGSRLPRRRRSVAGGSRRGRRGEARGIRRAAHRRPARCSTPRASSSTRTSGARGVAGGGDRGRRRAAAGTLFLELDRATGRRGRRFRAAEDEVVALTGAEDALVTNNNAAAVALAVGLAGRGAASRCRAASSSRSAAASGSRRSSAAPARGSSRWGRRIGLAWPTSRRSLADGRATARPAGPPIELRASTGFVEAPDPAELAAVAHRARRDRRRRPRVAGRCSTPRGSGWRTSRCRASASRRAPTS